MPNTVTAALTILKKADIETMSAGRGLPNNQNAPALPAWPLLTLLYGFPIIWALGLLQIAPIILAFVMLGYMLVRGSVRIYPALWVWGALTFWVVVCAVSLVEPTDLIAWGFRFSGVFCAGVFTLYYFNARAAITPDRLLGGLVTLWVTLVILGWGGVLFPNFRLQTPMSFIMPASILQNPLARDYMLPPLAEVQRPWGAPEAYNRPSAPFPYANSWGLAYTLLTPIMLAYLLRLRNRWAQAGLVVALLLSTVPAVKTSNRGMFIGLGIVVAYVLLRQLFARNWRAVAFGVGVAAVGVIGLFATGTVAEILGRQNYSDSTGGRAALYKSTWEATLQSPIVGYGTPRMEPSVGVSMGTQGYLWTLMFCFGFVGLGLFLVFLSSAVFSGLRVGTASGYWLHAVPVSCFIVLIFYSFDITQLSVLLLSSALCVRSNYYGEGL